MRLRHRVEKLEEAAVPALKPSDVLAVVVNRAGMETTPWMKTIIEQKRAEAAERREKIVLIDFLTRPTEDGH